MEKLTTTPPIPTQPEEKPVEVPRKLIESLLDVFKEFQEMYLRTNSLTFVLSKGRVKDGTIQIPQHTAEELSGKEVIIGVLRTEEEETHPAAKQREGGE